LRILCADDNVLLGDVMLCLFRRAGHTAEHVANGQEAWERLCEGHYDVLVTDHHMPGLNGLELVELARQGSFAGRIVVHTSSLTPDQVERYRGLGVAAIVIKSSSAEELIRAVETDAVGW
jgi:CheY-like chemotaxis protein